MTTATIAAAVTELNAEEWLWGTISETLQNYDITAASTESDLDIAAEEIDADALDSNIRLIGTRTWLYYAHYEMVSGAKIAAVNSIAV